MRERTVPGQTHPDWPQVEQEFHREWSTRLAPLGVSWEEARPAFRFGWEHAQSPAYAKYDWSQAAPDLAQHWYSPLEATEEMAWDNLQDIVREGWERARRGQRPQRQRGGGARNASSEG